MPAVNFEPAKGGFDARKPAGTLGDTDIGRRRNAGEPRSFRSADPQTETLSDEDLKVMGYMERRD